jgi:hypothetical protein
MDVDTFARRESILKLREKLLRSESDIQNGRAYTVAETVAAMRKAAAEVGDVRKE